MMRCQYYNRKTKANPPLTLQPIFLSVLRVLFSPERDRAAARMFGAAFSGIRRAKIPTHFA